IQRFLQVAAHSPLPPSRLQCLSNRNWSALSGASGSWLRRSPAPAESHARLPRQSTLIGRKKVMECDKSDNRERNGKKCAHRPPYPGPEGERQEHRKRIERQSMTQDGRRDELALDCGECHEGSRRGERKGQ